MNTKKEEDKVSFNLSPSSLNLYYQSPLLFYFTHIAKIPEDTPVPVCYGISGQIVHECLEKYAKKLLARDEAYMHLLSQWEEKDLYVHQTVNGDLLNKQEYLAALIKGMQVVDSHENHICEEMITLPFKENELMKIGLKGIIDLQAIEKGDQRVIIDYKTSNSVDSGLNFKRQALFYNLLLHKKKNIIPSKTAFHYLKLGISKEYQFTLPEIESFEAELDKVANELLLLGTSIENYPIGQIEDMFNSRKQACLQEIQRRKIS